jgi:hypothetical protein
MQTQTLKIQIPKGYQVASFDENTGEIKLKEIPKAVTDRIKTVADVLADNGVTPEEFDELCEGLDPDEKAYRIMKLLTKSLNEGWVPDWNNSNEVQVLCPGLICGVLPGFGSTTTIFGIRIRVSALAFASKPESSQSMPVSSSLQCTNNSW